MIIHTTGTSKKHAILYFGNPSNYVSGGEKRGERGETGGELTTTDKATLLSQ